MIAALMCCNVLTACADPMTEDPKDDTEQTDDEDKPDDGNPDDENQEDKPDDQDPVPEPEPVEDDGILKILAIGNSFSQDAVEQYLWQLFDAAGIKAVIGNLYIGGCKLETHYKNMQSGNAAYEYRKVENGTKQELGKRSILQGITDENWDYISLQQASGSSGIYSTYTPYLPGLIDYVQEKATNPEMKIAFHQTWAYATTSDHAEFPKYDSDQMVMYADIMSAVQNALADNPEIEILIPSGTAIQNGRNSYLGDTFNRDGYHLDLYYGRYTAACTWFETFSGQSAAGNAYVPDGVDSDQAAIAQTAAHFACESPYTVNPMTDFQSPQVTSDGNTPIYVDFGTKPTSGWNNVSVYSLPDDGKIFLKDKNGNYTSVTVSSLEGFTETWNGAGSEPADMDFEAGDITWPRSAWVDGILVKGTPGAGNAGPATITLSGLDPAKTYTFDILSTRWNGSVDARKMEVTLKGATESETSELKQGIGNKNNQVLENVNHAEFTMTPDSSGEVVISITGLDTGSAADGLISAMIISM